MKIHRLIYNSQISLKHFYTRSFKFDNFNFFDLNLGIPEHEMEEFGIVQKLISNKDYYFNGFKMARKVILNETEREEAIARQRYPYVYLITKLIHVIAVYLAFKLFYTIISFIF